MGFIGNIIARIGADVRPLQDAIREANRSLESLDLSGASKLGGKLTAGVTAPLVGLGAAAVKSAGNFEQGMANIKAVTGASGQDMDKLSKLAISMGENTKYSAVEAASGIEELAKAGLTTEQIINGGLSGALNLAAAGGLELKDAATIASTALNAFKSDNLSVGKAADILAGAANASASNVSELQVGLSQVSSVSSAVGMSMNDTTAALAVFSNNGLKGSDAGTSLKTMLMNLQPTTKEQKKAFKDLGLTTKEGTSAFFDATGKLKSMNEIAGLLKTSMGGMTDAQRLQTMETLFGSDAIRAANILYKEGKTGIDNMKTSMGKVSAEQVAAEKMNTFNGSMEKLKGNLETLGISIGTLLLPVITNVTNFMSKLVDKFNALDPSTKTLIVQMASMAAVLGPILLLVGSLSTALTALGAVLLFLTSPIGLIVLAVAALAAGFIYLWNTNEGFRNAVTTAWNEIKTKATEVWDWVSTKIKDIANWINTTAIPIYNSFKTTITTAWDAIKLKATEVWDWVSTKVKGVTTWISDTAISIYNTFKDTIVGGWDTVKSKATEVWDWVFTKISGVVTWIRDTALGIFTTSKDTIVGAWDTIKTKSTEVWDSVGSKIEGVWTGIKTNVKNGINATIGFINGFIKKINSISISIPSVTIPGVGTMGGQKLSFPQIPEIPMLAKGGIVDKPTLAMIGEAGPEAVVPLGKMNQGMIINITGNTISSTMDLDNIANQLVKKLRMAGVRP